jgi:uncharacterized protein
MRDGFRIIDADRHVVEPLALWREHLPPELREHAPLTGSLPDEPLQARLARLGAKGLLPVEPLPTIDGRPLWKGMSELAWIEFCSRGYQYLGRSELLQRPEPYLADMNRSGVDVACLFPTYGLLLEGSWPVEPRVAASFAEVYNTWLHGFCGADPTRLRGVGLISRHEPAAMVPELRRIAGFGWKTVMVRPNPIGGRLLSDPAYAPFWAACEELSIAVAIHGSAHVYVPSVGGDRFESRFASHACAAPMELMMALLALIEGGVLERHPKLRIAALEGGAGWLPFWSWRLDAEYRSVGAEVEETVRQPPSTYLRRQCFISMEADESYLPDMLRHLSEDRLVFGTDFPHLDHDSDVIGELLALRGRISDDVLRKILWDNPARFFGIES